MATIITLILITHITVASLGIGLSLMAALRPSHLRFKQSLIFIALMLLSGSYLIISTGSGLKAACVSGLGYLTACLSLLAIGARRLSRQD